MSGEFVCGVYENNKIDIGVFNTSSISEFQKNSINNYYVKDIENFNDKKVLTEKQVFKLIDKYDVKLSKWHNETDKYSLFAYRLGISKFVKYKPKFKKNLNKEFYKAKKDEKFVGYTLKIKGKIECDLYKTITEAKNKAIEKSLNSKNILDISICKIYQKNYSITKVITEGIIDMCEIKSYKTKPKSTTTNGTIILPNYYFLWEATVSDAEYEWM